MRSDNIHQVLDDLAGRGLLVGSTGNRIAARLAAAAGNLCAAPSNCVNCIVQCRSEIVISRL